MNTKTEI